MVIFGIVLLIITPILLVFALAVRFAGNRRVLNSIDYTTIVDPIGLHRWSGGWLLALPALSLIFGVLALDQPWLGIVGGGLLVISAILVMIRILVGSDRFR